MSDRASWLLYLVGSLLVFGSWIHIVPDGLGWIVALGGGQLGPDAIDRTTRTHPVPSAEQIEKLDALRQRNVITDDDFEPQKRRLLGQTS
jgi:hypothetical protein